MLFHPTRRPVSLFDRRRRSRLSGKTLLRYAAVVVVVVILAIWAMREVPFYSALYECRQAISRQDFTQARQAFERAWQQKPEHPYVLDVAGLLFLHEQATDWRAKARENYTNAIAKGLKRNPFINHVKEARRLLDAGHYEQAEVELEHTLALFPKNATANLLAGHFLYARGHLKKAIDQYQKALPLKPGSAEIQNAITRAQEAKSRGSLPYLLDRHGKILAAQNVANSRPVYPCDFWAAHLTGYRSTKRGSAGLEKALDAQLKGNIVTLTVDAHLQRIVDAALGWQKGAIVVLKPQTGEILASVSHPTYRPSRINKEWWKIVGNPNNPLKNRAMEALYEPGSVAKIISTAALIESRVDTSKMYPFKCRGYRMIGNETFWDWRGHGRVKSLAYAFNNSCNIAMSYMAPLVGAAALTQYLRSFGFGEQDRINLELPVSVSRAPLNPDTPFKLASAFTGLGRGFRITPLHAAMIAAAVANGGVMMAPQLVKEIRSVTGTVISTTSPRVYQISTKKETASALTKYMMDFVKSGIGKKARMIRYHVAGKTGTSGSSEKGLHGWFVCFAPAEKPQLAVAILCENGGSGHAVAAPLAQRVLAEGLR